MPRPTGLLIAYGYPKVATADELALALAIGAAGLEILPDWPSLPDLAPLASAAADAGLAIWGVHGGWGSRTIRALRIDLGSPDPAIWRESLDDLRRCVDWAAGCVGSWGWGAVSGVDRAPAAGRTPYLVVHPGGLSEPADHDARREALGRGLLALADHAAGAVSIHVENMPPGVHPGSRMADLAALLDDLNHPGLGLTLDTGHAHISVGSAATETLAAGRWLRSTHVHDNDGRRDSHELPGLGSVSWPGWLAALDAIGYDGPIILECVRKLRESPEAVARCSAFAAWTRGGRTGMREARRDRGPSRDHPCWEGR